MVSVFKCAELIAFLSLMCHSWGYPSRYFHVAAAAITAPPISVITVTITAAPSSTLPIPAPASGNTVLPDSALPTSTPAPGVPTLTSGELPDSFPQNGTVTSGINFDPSWQECEIF
jgi:hypothetical protein